MTMRLSYWCMLWLSFLIVGGTDAVSTDAAPHQENSEECGIYLAQSTIPHAGLGMYAGKDFKKGIKVTDGDIIIPLIEVDWNNNHDENWTFLWDDYVWSKSDIIGMELEEVEGAAVSAASMGIGAAINCRLSMINIEASWNQIDSGGLHRSKDPGAGAITPYHDRRSFALSDIHAGQELFISYGENYFASRQSTYGPVPMVEDFQVADALLQNLTNILQRVYSKQKRSFALQHDLWTLVTKFPFKSRVINALPANVTDISRVLKIGTGQQYPSTRNVEWLQQNGACADNIQPGMSTIKGAGRGAFATRPIPKGAVVAPAPLLHITNKTRMTMYSVGEPVNGEIPPNSSNPVHSQLLVNYCFGHDNSSLLLSSYGVMTGLINHSSKKPNVRLEWSNIMMHSDWCDYTLEQLSQQSHAGLVFDYIAVRDIKEGEEILLDYGIEWEQAWNAHVQHWKPPPDAETYMPAYHYEMDPDSILRTIHEEAYSPNILIYLYEEYRLFHGLHRAPPQHQEWHRARILDRHFNRNNETVYMVEIFHEHEDERSGMTWIQYDREILFGVERDAFQFLDEPYTRDHSLHSTFRHPMMIPDDMFPEQWKNLP